MSWTFFKGSTSLCLPTLSVIITYFTEWVVDFLCHFRYATFHILLFNYVLKPLAFIMFTSNIILSTRSAVSIWWLNLKQLRCTCMPALPPLCQSFLLKSLWRRIEWMLKVAYNIRCMMDTVVPMTNIFASGFLLYELFLWQISSDLLNHRHYVLFMDFSSPLCSYPSVFPSLLISVIDGHIFHVCRGQASSLFSHQ